MSFGVSGSEKYELVHGTTRFPPPTRLRLLRDSGLQTFVQDVEGESYQIPATVLKGTDVHLLYTPHKKPRLHEVRFPEHDSLLGGLGVAEPVFTKGNAMTRIYKPNTSSLLASFVWDFSPALIALIGYCFAHEGASARGLGWLLLVATVAMCLFSVFLLLQTIAVHLRSVTIWEDRISVTGLLGGTTIPFSSIAKAVLRERVNPVSRTDHLVLIQSRTGQLLTSNSSTLPPDDEDDFLTELRRHVDLQEVRDKPAL